MLFIANVTLVVEFCFVGHNVIYSNHRIDISFNIRLVANSSNTFTIASKIVNIQILFQLSRLPFEKFFQRHCISEMSTIQIVSDLLNSGNFLTIHSTGGNR